MGQIFKILTWRDFGPLRQWFRNFPSTIYYPFWPFHGRKFRFGLFDQGATKWVKFPNFSPEEINSVRNLTPMVPKVSLQDFLPILGAPRPKITNRSFWPLCYQMVLLTGMRPNPGFRPFWPLCDYFPISVLLTNGATNGELLFVLILDKLYYLKKIVILIFLPVIVIQRLNFKIDLLTKKHIFF